MMAREYERLRKDSDGSNHGNENVDYAAQNVAEAQRMKRRFVERMRSREVVGGAEWSGADAGDRADPGLRRVKSRDGKLVKGERYRRSRGRIVVD